METEEIQSEKGFNLRLEARLKNASLVGARETLGMTGRAMARAIGISYSSYHHYENMSTYPLSKTQTKICQYFRNKGVFLTKEQVFPAELKGMIYRRRKSILEREISVGLLPYSYMEQRLLPSVEIEIEENLKHQELSRDINSVLSKLPYRQEQILRAFFGIGTEKKDTSQLSKEYNLSRQRISQIKNEALAKLRRASFRKILTPYLENSPLREH